MTDGDPRIYYRKEEAMADPTPAGTPTPVGPASATQPATDPSKATPVGPSTAATLQQTGTTVRPSAPGEPVTASAVAATGNYAAARQLIVNQPQKYDAVIRALERARGEIDQQIQALRNDRDASAVLIAQGL